MTQHHEQHDHPTAARPRLTRESSTPVTRPGRPHAPGHLAACTLRALRLIGLASVTLVLLPASASAAGGALTQLPGMDGCVSETGTLGQCEDGRALRGARSVTVSPDGRNAYSASQFSDAVDVFSRERTTGALDQLPGSDGCVSETGSLGECADGKALDDASSAAVSPDGRNVYVASQISDAVAAFSRDPRTGALTQLPGTDGCVSETGSGGQCEDGKALDGANAVTVSPDGKNAYVASFNSRAVAAFARERRGDE